MLQALTHRYATVELIGAGGMGQVYVATKVDGGRVVVKQLHEQLAFDTDARELFLHEARVAMRLEHPNVVPVLDVFEVEGLLTLELPLIEGLDARGLCARTGTLSPGLATAVLTDVLAALGYVHALADERGRPLHLVHRDVSGGNVLLGLDGVARLTDFGIARSADRIRRTQGLFRGTLAVASPEQATGRPTDARSDLFSAGALLYGFLTGRGPFEAHTLAETAQRLERGQFQTLEDGHPLGGFLARALAHAPSARFPSAQSMADELQAIRRAERWTEGPAELGRAVRDALAVRPPAIARALAALPTGEQAAPAPPSSDAVGGGAGARRGTVAFDAEDKPEPRRGTVALDAEGKREPRRGNVALDAAGPLGGHRGTVALDAEGEPSAGRAPSERGNSMRAARARRRRWVVGAAAALGAGLALLTLWSASARRPVDVAAPPPPPLLEAPTVAAADVPAVSPPGVSPAELAVPADAGAPERPPPAVAQGVVTINARPWATVYVDGRHVGETPIRALRLAAGRHRVRLVNSPLSVDVVRVIDVKPERAVQLVEDLERAR